MLNKSDLAPRDTGNRLCNARRMLRLAPTIGPAEHVSTIRGDHRRLEVKRVLSVPFPDRGPVQWGTRRRKRDASRVTAPNKHPVVPVDAAKMGTLQAAGGVGSACCRNSHNPVRPRQTGSDRFSVWLPHPDAQS